MKNTKRNCGISTLSMAIDSGSDILPFLFTYVLLCVFCSDEELLRITFAISDHGLMYLTHAN